jgi:hypothetical protein
MVAAGVGCYVDRLEYLLDWSITTDCDAPRSRKAEEQLAARRPAT